MPNIELTTTQQDVDLDPLAIDKALTTLWREYSAVAQQSGTVAARARLANLISLCADNDESETAAGAVARLNMVRPVRYITVMAPETGTPEAAAALKCMGLDSRVCYEEIALNTPGETARALPALLEPLMVPDLPTYLWFPGDPHLENPNLVRIFDIVDRVVLDSHHFTNPLQRFRQIHEWMLKTAGTVVFTEMTWTRLGTWREAVGKLFDPQENRDQLLNVRKLIVRSVHADGEPSDRSMLMTGWIASKLGWKPGVIKRGNPVRASFESASGPVDVEWAEGPATARGHLLGLEFIADGASFRVERQHNDPSGAIRSFVKRGGQETAGPAYHPLHWQTHELLCNALEIRTPFADWEDSLAAIAGLTE